MDLENRYFVDTNLVHTRPVNSDSGYTRLSHNRSIRTRCQRVDRMKVKV